MKGKWLKVSIPLGYVKPVCMVAVIAGIFFFVSGNWISGLCMLLGAYILERHNYCCPDCRGKLDMKHSLGKESRCPFCGGKLLK